MANNYGYMAKIGLADDGLEKSLAEINNSLKEIDRSISATDKAISNAGKSGLDTTQLWEQQYDLLNTQIETTSEKLSALESVQSKIAEAYENGAIDYSAYISFQNEVANTAAELEKLKARAEQAHTAMTTPADGTTTYQSIQNALEEVNGKFAKAVRELNEVDGAMKQSGQSEELLAQKSQLLGEAIQAAQVKLTALTHEQERMNEAVKSGDTSAEEYRTFQREIANTTAELEKLTKEQENLGKETEDTTNKSITLGDVIKANVVSDLITKGIETLTDAFKKLGEEIQNVVVQTAAYGDTVDKQSQRLGMTEKSYQEWTYILSQNGANISSLTTGMRTLTNAVDNAQNGAKAATTAFEKLGISVDDLNGLTGEQQFSLVVSRLQAMSDETERNAVANDILGRSYQTLIPLLNQDSDTVERLRQKANDTNQILNEKGVQAAVNYTDAMDTLNKSIDGFKHALGAEVLPILTELIEQITEIINETNKEDIDELLNDISDAAKSLIEIVNEFVDNGGIEKIIDIMQWIINHGDALVGVLVALGSAWAADKVVKFGVSLLDLPGKINNVIAAIGQLPGKVTAAKNTLSGLGSTAQTSMNALTTAVTGAQAPITVSLGAIAAAAAAAAAAIASAVALADELNTIADGMTNLTAETKKSDENVRDMSDRWGNISDMTGLDKYKEASAMLDDVIASEEEWNARYKKTIDELNVLQEKKFKNADETARMKELQNQKDSLDAEYSALQMYHTLLSNEIDKYDDETLKRLERQAEEQAQIQTNAGKTNKQAIEEFWENRRATTKAEMEKYDSELATHKIDDTEYWAKRKAYLEAHKDEESADWWAYYDAVNQHYEKLSEEERKAAEKAASESKKALEKAAKEKADALKKATSDAWAAAEREQQEKGYGDEWLLNEYQKILDTLEKGSDLYLEYYDKWLKLRNDIQNEDIKEWEDSSKKTADSIKKAYEDVNKAQADAEKDYMKSMSQLGENVTEKGGKERFVLNDLDKESEKLQKYRESMDKLKATGISDDLLAGVMQFDYKDGSRQQFINELLGMSDKQREQYFKDYEEYIAEVKKTGQYDVQDKLDEANKMAAEGVADIYSNMPDVAYQKGKDTADSYIQGIIDSMSGYDPLIGGSFFNSINGKNLSTAVDNTSSAAGGDVVINFIVDGEIITTKVVNNMAQEIRRGGNPLNA
ncbi:MAG: hypothetical protein ACI4GX_04975 [Ruminococcus sp.]